MNKILIIFVLSLFVLSCSKDSDKDKLVEKKITWNKNYKTVKIGNQIWMAENFCYLDKEILNEGAVVYGYSGKKPDEAMETEEYRDYGVLYNWNTAVELCPEGWRLPTDDDWKQLEISLGMAENVADIYGSADKKIGARGDKKIMDKMISKDWGGNNESGLTLMPGGAKDSKGFIYLHRVGNYWTATEENDYKSIIRGLAPILLPVIQRCGMDKETFLSVRYIKDIK